MTKELTKSLPIRKRMVYESYLKVTANGGSAGIDKETIELFNQDLPGNLYQLWNRMASGSYFPPPVRTVFIPKKQGGFRPLGIPTVSDRIAQGVVKNYLEPDLEKVFRSSSFGYRPGKSAHDALEQCRSNCYRYDWVIDVDIKGFFDHIDHDLMMQLLQEHTTDKWVLLYVERWLKAGVEGVNGCIVLREKGTPQGGVISPLLANIYLHHCFDKWMDTINPQHPFERYADDIVIHCGSRREAEGLLEKLRERMREFKLELHPEKTRIVYCKDYRRKDSYANESFTFLSYTFAPRTNKSKHDTTRMVLTFSAFISQGAKKHIRQKIKEVLYHRRSSQPLEWTASKLNPKIRGWINYFSKFNRDKVLNEFMYLNTLIKKWIKNTYKLRSISRVVHRYNEIVKASPDLFYHWKLGITF